MKKQYSGIHKSAMYKTTQDFQRNIYIYVL